MCCGCAIVFRLKLLILALFTGADGVIQSMMLSIGGLQFKDSHLEFTTHPKDLHRDYFWRRLNYGNNTHLNLSVIVDDDNKAQLRAALDRNDRAYFACDAGCLDKPVQLGYVYNRQLN